MRELISRAQTAELTVILAPSLRSTRSSQATPGREGIRLAVDDWIRTAGHALVDFDAAMRSAIDPSRLEDKYAAPDHTLPNVNGGTASRR